MLAKAGADLRLRTPNGRTAVQMAQAMGDEMAGVVSVLTAETAAQLADSKEEL